MRHILIFGCLLLATLTASAHGISDADKQGILQGGNLEYIRLGATHMLTGYDHLLFLFGVIFFLTKFRDIVKFVTAFTLGHCITLVFATLLHVKADYFLIDAVIALTVCYKAFDNLDGFKKYIGVQYALYFKGGTKANLTLDLPKGNYRVEWVDGLTGEIAQREQVKHAGGTVGLAPKSYPGEIALRIRATR